MVSSKNARLNFSNAKKREMVQAIQEIKPRTIYFSLDTPCDTELEKTMLGSLLAHNHFIPEADKVINYDCFFEELHAKIYKKLTDEYYQHGAVDAVTITSYLFHSLKISSDIEDCRELINNMIFPDGLKTSCIKSIAGRVNELYRARIFLQSLCSAASEFAVMHEKEDQGWSIDGMISLGEQKIISSRPRSKHSCKKICDLIPNWQEQKLTSHGRKSGKGLMTGFSAIDNYIQGLQKSQLIILAGRTSMGKTAFALNILANICDRFSTLGEDGGVALFSLEMSSSELISRFVSMVSGKDLSNVASSNLSSRDAPRITTATNYLKKLNFVLDDYQDLTFSELRSRCLRLVKHQNVKCICVDYLQLIKAEPGMSSAYRTGFITQLTAKLKALARELDVPIIVLSQLSRAPESRVGRRPELSDLRDSGTIEQDADIVLFIYRQKYYELLRTKPEKDDPEYAEWAQKLEAARNDAAIIVAKNRNGPLGDTELKFIPEIVKFENIIEDSNDKSVSTPSDGI